MVSRTRSGLRAVVLGYMPMNLRSRSGSGLWVCATVRKGASARSAKPRYFAVRTVEGEPSVPFPLTLLFP